MSEKDVSCQASLETQEEPLNWAPNSLSIFMEIKPEDDHRAMLVVLRDAVQQCIPIGRMAFAAMHHHTRDGRHNGMSFGEAITAVRNAYRMCRAEWAGNGAYLRLASMAENRAWIECKTESGAFKQWTPSQADMLANDWAVYIGDLH